MYNPEQACEFLKKVYFRENAPLNMAVKRAYRDFNRTISFEDICHKNTKGYEEERKQLIESVVNLFENQIKTANHEVDVFDNWHSKMCQLIIDKYKDKGQTLNYGQAQKWVNMTLKYLTIINQIDNNIEEYIKHFIKTHGQYFHIPIDSIILDVIEGKGDYKGINLDIQTDNLILLIKYKDNKRLCWSKWDKTYYESFQQTLINNIKKCNLSPLDWEFKYWKPKIIEN